MEKDIRGVSPAALTLQTNDNGEKRKKILSKVKEITKNKIKFISEPEMDDLTVNFDNNTTKGHIK